MEKEILSLETAKKLAKLDKIKKKINDDIALYFSLPNYAVLNKQAPLRYIYEIKGVLDK